MYLEDLAKKSFYFCNTFNVKIEHGDCFIMKKYTHNKKEISISQTHCSDTTSVDIIVFSLLFVNNTEKLYRLYCSFLSNIDIFLCH